MDKAQDEYDRLRGMVKDVLNDQISEQQAVLDKLWDQFKVPEDQRAAFYRGIPNLYSEEGLEALMNEVDKLKRRLLSSKKLIKLILKRKAFIQKMLEFEVLATDPKRLFKSSTILNKEEAFRKAAYPTLLQLEDAIREALDQFEQETGEPFMWEGDYYLVTLEKEIEERPMDPTVFGAGQGRAGRKKLNAVKRSTPKTSSSSTRPTGGMRPSARAGASSPGTGLPAGFRAARKK